ncbi:MAG: NADH-quinone oxidoreductase subunit M [Chloroflexi bacterium]|nr:NADH-quinone oxidoreductase subunit M [Chloroflexota bacterium]
MNFPILSIILLLPAVGAAIIIAFPWLQLRGIRMVALAFTLVPLALALTLYILWSTGDIGFADLEEKRQWIPSINAFYHLGVDGLSLPMVLLTTLLGSLAVLVSWKVPTRQREYFAWLLVLETGILGVFTSLDLLLFFLFWEVELIPMYMLISIWGTGRREYSAIKFVTYTLLGSALMLTGILALYFSTGSFSMLELANLSSASLTRQVLPLSTIFLLIFAAFAIKLPMFPFHTWLPDAHTDAPTAVSVILAGVLLKMGGYGMIRILVGIFPQQARDFAPLAVALAVVSVLYGAAVTLRQTDLKRLIAYSSVSHMGYVLLGIFALTPTSLTGATLQMFSHGLVTGLLFALVGLVYDKSHERDLRRLGGLARQMPIIAVVFSVAGLASLGLPGTSGFAAEFTTFVGSFTSPNVDDIKIYTLLGMLGIVVTAGYILWMLQRAFYGPPQEKFGDVPDASLLERVPIFTLMVAAVLVGVLPMLLTDVIREAPVIARVGDVLALWPR